MNGRRLYQYAGKRAQVDKGGLDKPKMHISEIGKVLIHQANGKMDDAILARLFKLYNIDKIPELIMPMTISWLGNSSVATVPTLLDILVRGGMKEHSIRWGYNLVLESVGAVMNINSVVYKMA